MSGPSRTTVSLTDDDIRDRLTPAEVVAAMREVMVSLHRGTFTAPARAREGDAASGNSRGPVQSVAVADDWFGYVSQSGEHYRAGDDSVVVIHDRATRAPRAMAVGSELARLRVAGTIGVAAEALSQEAAAVLAILGTGPGVPAAIRAVASVRFLDSVRVTGAPGQLSSDAAVNIESFASAREAVRGAAIVLIVPADSTAAPLELVADDLDPGCVVIVIGRLDALGQDLPTPLIASLDVLVTDSSEQLAAYPKPHPLAARLHEATELGAIADGTPARRQPTDRVGFFSVEIAAADAFLLNLLISRN